MSTIIEPTKDAHNPTAAGSNPALSPPAAVGVASNPPGISAEKYNEAQTKIDALQKQIENLKIAHLSEADREKAQAAAAAEKMSAQLSQLSEQNAQIQKQAKVAAKLSHLNGLKDPTYLQLAPEVELTDVGILSAESKAALDKFRAERPELFNAPATATTPLPTGSARLQASEYNHEQKMMLRGAKLNPESFKDPRATSAHGWLMGFDATKDNR